MSCVYGRKTSAQVMTKVPRNQRCPLKQVQQRADKERECAPRLLVGLSKSSERRCGAFVFGKQVGLFGPSTFLLGLSKSKAAVVGAGLAANGGKGGARPRRGGAGLLRPGGPTNRPARRAGAATVGRGGGANSRKPGPPAVWRAGRRLRRAA
jgi:hypothetical protein